MKKILIIDDEYLTVEMLSTFLKIIGHDTMQALNAQQARERVAASPPDAILLDIMLPDVSGIQLCRELRSMPSTTHTPIVMISAQAPPLLKEAEAAGANGYLVKPLNIMSLRKALESVGVVHVSSPAQI